jgi:hypothetical protein
VLASIEQFIEMEEALMGEKKRKKEKIIALGFYFVNVFGQECLKCD